MLPSYINEVLKAYFEVSSEDRRALLDEELFNFDPLSCDERYLVYFALEFNIKTDGLETFKQRRLINAASLQNNIIGTKKSILEALRLAGLSNDILEALVIEYFNKDDYKFKVKRDRSFFYNSIAKHNDGSSMYDFDFNNWFEFAVVIKKAISNKQKAIAEMLINRYKPVRAKLIGFKTDIRERNGCIQYNRLYTH